MHTGHRHHSDATAREIDLAVRGMIDDAYAAAKTMLNESLDELNAGAELLLQRESITPSDFPPLLRPLANHPKEDVSPALVADS